MRDYSGGALLPGTTIEWLSNRDLAIFHLKLEDAMRRRMASHRQGIFE